jgi:hypothetical protein
MRRDVRLDQLAGIGKRRKFCGGDDVYQRATWRLE